MFKKMQINVIESLKWKFSALLSIYKVLYTYLTTSSFDLLFKRKKSLQLDEEYIFYHVHDNIKIYIQNI